MFADNEAEIRADLADRGWSAQADLGGRLRYADAIALVEDMAGDSSTRLGAKLGGFRYPVDLPGLVVIASLGGKDFPSPVLAPEEIRAKRAFKGDVRQERRAAKVMSPLFREVLESR